MQSLNSRFKESIIKFDSKRYKLIISFLVRERSLICFSFAKVAIILTILAVSVQLTCASSFLQTLLC